MEFKILKLDGLVLFAELVRREAADRDPAFAASLREIEFVENGRYGAGRPDVRMTVAVAPGLIAAVDARCVHEDGSASKTVEAAVELTDAAERIFRDRHNTKEMVREVRSRLSSEASKGRRRGLPYRTLGVSLTPCEAGSDDLPAARIRLEVIGPLLATEAIAFEVESEGEVADAFAEMRQVQEQRLVQRRHLERIGADVLIDAITLAALEAAKVDLAAAVAKLQGDEVGIIDIDTDDGRIVLFARDGVVTGNVPLGDGMRWHEGRLTLPKARKVPSRAKGKPLSRVIDHPCFNETMIVTGVNDFGDSVWIWVHTRPVALSLQAQRQAA